MELTIRRDPKYEVASLPLALSNWLYPIESLFSAEGARVIRAEEFVEGSDMVIRLEMPDVDPDKDVDVRITNNSLCVSAERHEQMEKSQYRTELRYGLYERMLPLPEGVTQKDIHASYKDGILELRVTVPEIDEAERDETHRIKVSHK